VFVNNPLPDWIVRGVADNGAAHQSAGSSLDTANEISRSKSSRPNGLDSRPAHPVEAGKLAGGLISWNKGFIGSGLSRLHSLL